jgi:hypothetical protein
VSIAVTPLSTNQFALGIQICRPTRAHESAPSPEQPFMIPQTKHKCLFEHMRLSVMDNQSLKTVSHRVVWHHRQRSCTFSYTYYGLQLPLYHGLQQSPSIAITLSGRQPTVKDPQAHASTHDKLMSYSAVASVIATLLYPRVTIHFTATSLIPHRPDNACIAAQQHTIEWEGHQHAAGTQLLLAASKNAVKSCTSSPTPLKVVANHITAAMHFVSTAQAALIKSGQTTGSMYCLLRD